MEGFEENRLKRYSSKSGFNYLLPDSFVSMELGESRVHGKGTLLKQSVKKGDIICPLIGVLYNMNKAKIDYPKYSYQISDEISIETENEPGFFNHSCDPNVFINDDWMFEAIKDIESREEVLVDYGTVDYFDYKFECLCKAENCRKNFDGKISGDPEYQKEKSKYFSPYLKSKFSLL